MNEFIRVIHMIKNQHPDLRISQIIAFVDKDPYYLSDSEFALEIMKAYINNYQGENTDG